jgi:hypothetical protein
MKQEPATFSPCRQYRYSLWRQWELDPENDMNHGCCHAGRDGDCCWEKCPQIRDKEPKSTGRHCILDKSGGYLMVVGLNPSTADETSDDPTIRKCVGFAKKWGFEALVMTNLFAWRDTLPANMKKVKEPVGEDCDKTLLEVAEHAGMILAAWGKDGSHQSRDFFVKRLFTKPMYCLKKNKDGSPMHPLYVPYDTVPEVYYTPKPPL